VFVDLDRFKYVNDTLGHDVGDRLLQVMAERLTAAVAESDTVARLGGDEFVLLLHGHSGPDTVATVLEQLLPKVAAPLRYGQNDLEVTCSIGVALYPDDGIDSATLLKHADSAMYRAKEQGRNNFQFFTEELNRAMKERFDLESHLRRALERGQFELHYQPRVDLATRKIIGAEALMRWHVPGRGLVSPAAFIPVAEEIGLIGPITEWVLHAACTQNKRWLDAGLACVVSVNVSPQLFRGDGLVPLIAKALADTGMAAGCLEIEITESTESTVMDAGERMVEKLHAIKKLGVHIAVDDFGTGYSSLSYLQRFPVDRLKVDRSFVQHMDDADDAVIVRAIIALGHNLGLKVLAEGVETDEQVAFLRANGCDELQGYLVSKPVSAWQMTKLLVSGEAPSAAQDCPPTRDVQQAL
jgi:diguanylate cyclase (GGDEF)-like protein